MNVLWTKRKLNKTMSKETVTVHAHASGDGCTAPSRCRLCGGNTNLRAIGETYKWDGVEARYDQLLYECFGVTVSSPDSLICAACVRQLRSTEKFRMLVHAAFKKSQSESTLDSNQSTVLPKKPSTERTYVMTDKVLPAATNQAQKIASMHVANKNRSFQRKSILKKASSLRRVNVPCSVCRQRYPAMVPKEGCQKFVCPRCKKKSIKTEVCRRCNLIVPANMMRKHLEMHLKDDLRANIRLRNLRKTLQVRTENNPKTTLLPKFKCSQCPKKFDIALNLMNHMKSIHRNSSNHKSLFPKGQKLNGSKCTCAVCGKEFRNKQMLSLHLKEHRGPLFQCGNCLTAFKNNRALQTHSYKCKVS